MNFKRPILLLLICLLAILPVQAADPTNWAFSRIVETNTRDLDGAPVYAVTPTPPELAIAMQIQSLFDPAPRVEFLATDSFGPFVGWTVRIFRFTNPATGKALDEVMWATLAWPSVTATELSSLLGLQKRTAPPKAETPTVLEPPKPAEPVKLPGNCVMTPFGASCK